MPLPFVGATDLHIPEVTRRSQGGHRGRSPEVSRSGVARPDMTTGHAPVRSTSATDGDLELLTSVADDKQGVRRLAMFRRHARVTDTRVGTLLFVIHGANYPVPWHGDLTLVIRVLWCRR